MINATDMRASMRAKPPKRYGIGDFQSLISLICVTIGGNGDGDEDEDEEEEALCKGLIFLFLFVCVFCSVCLRGGNGIVGIKFIVKFEGL